MTRDMLLAEREHGVDKIVFTPHFYAQQENVQTFIRKRQEAYERTLELSSELGLDMDFKLGAEVYYFPGIGRADMLPLLRMGDTNYLLLEMPFAQWTEEIYLDVVDILHKQKIDIILAHIERFYQFQKDKYIWKEIMKLPIVMQINTGSLFEWRTRRFDKKLILDGYKVLLGTDCHNMTSRVPNMREGRKMLEKKLCADFLNEIDYRGERVWSNEKI